MTFKTVIEKDGKYWIECEAVIADEKVILICAEKAEPCDFYYYDGSGIAVKQVCDAPPNITAGWKGLVQVRHNYFKHVFKADNSEGHCGICGRDWDIEYLNQTDCRQKENEYILCDPLHYEDKEEDEDWKDLQKTFEYSVFYLSWLVSKKDERTHYQVFLDWLNENYDAPKKLKG